jgi:hypothetical protein
MRNMPRGMRGIGSSARWQETAAAIANWTGDHPLENLQSAEVSGVITHRRFGRS